MGQHRTGAESGIYDRLVDNYQLSLIDPRDKIMP